MKRNKRMSLFVYKDERNIIIYRREKKSRVGTRLEYFASAILQERERERDMAMAVESK